MKKILLLLLLSSLNLNIFGFDKFLGMSGKTLPSGELFNDAHKKTAREIISITDKDIWSAALFLGPIGWLTYTKDLVLTKLGLSKNNMIYRSTMLKTSKIIISAGKSITTKDELRELIKKLGFRNLTEFNKSFSEEELYYINNGDNL